MPETVLSCGALLDPEHSFYVLIEDSAPRVSIETSAGRVGPGWRLLVDERTARTAQPGAMVAAMSTAGQLVVGELAHEGDGEWAILTGVVRVPIPGDGVRGTVVEYQPPVTATGWIVRGEDEAKASAAGPAKVPV